MAVVLQLFYNWFAYQVTLTMTAGLYDDAPVQDQFNHGVRKVVDIMSWEDADKTFLYFNITSQSAMENLLSEMETAGTSCSGDDCEASYEVTEA